MMKKVLLIQYTNPIIRYGSVLRIPGQWPHEHIVDLLLVYLPGSDRESLLVVTTGHKAGLVLVMLPEESSRESERGSGISTEWLLNNWKTWIYPECSLDDVYVIERYDVPQA